MADANKIEVIIGANASGFRAGAKEAAEHTEGLIASMKDFKREAVQTGRQSKFFANELAEIIPGASGAKDALRGLIALGLSGNAFEGLIVGISLVTKQFEHFAEEQHKAAEELKKFTEDSTKYIEDFETKVEDILLAASGATRAEILAHTALKPLLKEEEELTGKLAKAKAALVLASNATVFTGEGAFAPDVSSQEAAVSAAESKLATIRANIARVNSGAGDVGDKDASNDAAKEEEESQKRHFAHMIEEAADFQRMRKQIYEAGTAETLRIVEDEFKREDDFQDIIYRHDIERAADFQRIAKQKYDATLAETMAYFDEQDKLATAAAKKMTHELGVVAKELGDAMGKNLAEVLKGTESIDDALNNMLQTMIKVAMQMAVMAALSAGGPLGILGAIGISAIGGALGGLTGGGGSSNVNVTQNFHGSASPGEHSQAMETMIVNVIRNARNRGRLT